MGSADGSNPVSYTHLTLPTNARVVINAASEFERARIDKLDFADFERVLRTTLFGTFNVCSVVLPEMRANGWGRIINVGCVGCERIYHGTNEVPYRIAVSGNLTLTKAYARQVFSDGITVNLVAPGYLENTMGEVEANCLPAGRLSRFEEITPVIRFLLSEEAAHISGACLAVSGGYVT